MSFNAKLSEKQLKDLLESKTSEKNMIVNNKTIIELSFHKISWFVSVSQAIICLCLQHLQIITCSQLEGHLLSPFHALKA